MLAVMSNLTSDLAEVNRPPMKFQPPQRALNYQKEALAHKEKIVDLFVQTRITPLYHWLHYNASSDSAFCHVCMVAEFEKKFLASTKRDPCLHQCWIYLLERTRERSSSCSLLAI